MLQNSKNETVARQSNASISPF